MQHFLINKFDIVSQDSDHYFLLLIVMLSQNIVYILYISRDLMELSSPKKPVNIQSLCKWWIHE